MSLRLRWQSMQHLRLRRRRPQQFHQERQVQPKQTLTKQVNGQCCEARCPYTADGSPCNSCDFGSECLNRCNRNTSCNQGCRATSQVARCIGRRRLSVDARQRLPSVVQGLWASSKSYMFFGRTLNNVARLETHGNNNKHKDALKTVAAGGPSPIKAEPRCKPEPSEDPIDEQPGHRPQVCCGLKLRLVGNMTIHGQSHSSLLVWLKWRKASQDPDAPHFWVDSSTNEITERANVCVRRNGVEKEYSSTLAELGCCSDCWQSARRRDIVLSACNIAQLMDLVELWRLRIEGDPKKIRFFHRARRSTRSRQAGQQKAAVRMGRHYYYASARSHQRIR